MEDEKRPQQSSTKGLSGADFAGLGIQFAAAIVVFLFIGQWLDKRFGTDGIVHHRSASSLEAARRSTTCTARSLRRRETGRRGAAEERAGEGKEGARLLRRSVGRSHRHRHHRSEDVFRTVRSTDAMLVSAGLAFAVQLGSYALLRPARAGRGAPGELLLRWAHRCGD